MVGDAGVEVVRSRRRVGRPSPGETLALVLALVTVAPIVVAGVRGLAAPWTPASDQAIEVLRMHEVGTRQTPLVGAYSRFGWNHPGPLLFWWGAGWLRAFGPGGVLASIAVLNLAGLTGALAAARRLGGTTLLVPVAAAAAVLVNSLGPARLVDPWNPLVTYLPLLCFLLCAAAAAEEAAPWALPVAVASGSFVAQSHLGAASLVGAAALGAAIWWWRARPATAPLPRPWRTGVLALALWSGPLLDQAVGEHNVSDLFDYLTSGEGTRPTLRAALGAAARELGFRPAWTGAPDTDIIPLVHPAPIWTLGLTAALLAGAYLLARRAPERRGARLVAFSAWLAVASVLAITRVTDGLLAYVVRWTWSVGALAAAAVVAVAIAAISPHPPNGDDVAPIDAGPAPGVGGGDDAPARRPAATGRATTFRPTIAGALLAGLVVVAAVASAATTVDAARDDLRPEANLSRAVRTLSAEVRADVPTGRYALDWQDPTIYAGLPQSLGMDLVRHGYDIRFPENEELTIGPARTGGLEGLPTLVVLAGGRRQAWAPPPGARRVATYRPRSPAEQRRAQALAARIRADAPTWDEPLSAVPGPGALQLVMHGAQPEDVLELGELQLRGLAYDAWLVPAP